jgi:hypothetical protein
MNNEIELIHETWNIVKPYVPKKDRVLVAECLLRLFDESINLDPALIREEAHDFDTALRAAVFSYYEFDEEEDEYQ